MDVYVKGQRLALGAFPLLGKGGEADVFDLGAHALKLFKTPDHPDLHGNPAEQDAARSRLDEHQRKLTQFPPSLPARVVAPVALATDRKGKSILGYTMRKVEHAEPLLRYSEPAFRRAVSANDVLQVFADLRETVLALHAGGVVIGDFNDLNVLVHGGEANVIDADSFQFGPFTCAVFTERFVDPRLLDASSRSVQLKRPFDPSSDWYAFHALLFQSLLLTSPFGGVHRGKPGSPKLTAAERLHLRMTVLRPEVQYPKPARAPSSLPDDLLHHFDRVFHRDERIPIRAEQLALQFLRCPSCLLEHARNVCPVCQPHATAKTTVAVASRGRVTATLLHDSAGVLVESGVIGGTLRFIEHVGREYRDHAARPLRAGTLDPSLRFLFTGGEPWMHARGVLAPAVGAQPGKARTTRAAVGSELGVFYTASGQLWRVGPYADEPVGAVLDGDTRLFLGRRFGAGLYRAGNVTVAFTFPRVREVAAELRLRGQLVATDAAFGDDVCWLRTEERHGGRARICLRVLGANGQLLAANDDADPEAWSTPLSHAAVVGGQLFIPTDAGIVRAEVLNKVPVQTRAFPDTEPFVSSATRLLVDAQGLIAAGDRRIQRLSMT